MWRHWRDQDHLRERWRPRYPVLMGSPQPIAAMLPRRMREQFPLQLRVVAVDNGYRLPVGYEFCWARRDEGSPSPYCIWAVDADGRVYQFRESEIEVLDPDREV